MNFFINSQPFYFEPKQTIMHAAINAGIYIPYFCWHPSLSVDASCRICYVEIEHPKGNILQPACYTEITEGMKVFTNSEKVLFHRQKIMEMLLVNHPVDCGICDKAGECLLQDYHFAHNGKFSSSKEPKHNQDKFHHVTENILLDNERCILCSRCVRFTQEISGSYGLGIISRGHHSIIRESPDGSFAKDNYSENVVDICPVGALLSKNFLYDSRVWYIKPTKSICPGCANGCEINIWHRRNDWMLKSVDKNKNHNISRVTPYHQIIENRPNNPINQNPNDEFKKSALNNNSKNPWICNLGRRINQFYNKNRSQYPMINGREEKIDKVINKIAELIQSAKNPSLLITNWASCDELIIANQLSPKIKKVFYNERECEKGETESDDFLIKADKNPNSAGVRKYIDNLLESIPKNCDLLIHWSQFGENFDFTLIQPKLSPNAKLITMIPFLAPENGYAQIHIPISLPIERNGSWINYQGDENIFKKCFTKPEKVVHAAEIFKKLVELRI